VVADCSNHGLRRVCVTESANVELSQVDKYYESMHDRVFGRQSERQRTVENKVPRNFRGGHRSVTSRYK
jgi:hypothetical protein